MTICTLCGKLDFKNKNDCFVPASTGGVIRDFICGIKGKNILVDEDEFNKSFLRRFIRKFFFEVLASNYSFKMIEAVFAKELAVISIFTLDEHDIALSMYKDNYGWSLLITIDDGVFSISCTNDLHEFSRLFDVICADIKGNAPPIN